MRKKRQFEPIQLTVKKKSLFDHLQAIYVDQSVHYWDDLSVENKKTYSVFMINRFISMNMDYIEVVNEFQKYWGIVGDRESYLFYSQLLPYGKQWNRYIKGKKERKYEEWVIRLLAHHFEVSQRDVSDYLDLMFATKEGRSALKEILEMYGSDPRKVKKVVR